MANRKQMDHARCRFGKNLLLLRNRSQQMSSRTKKTFAWLWIAALLTATIGISVQQIYCYCLGKTTFPLFSAGEGCSAEKKAAKPDCCARHKKQKSSCCAKGGKERIKGRNESSRRNGFSFRPFILSLRPVLSNSSFQFIRHAVRKPAPRY